MYNSLATLVAQHLEKEAKARIVPVFPPSSGSVNLSAGTVSQAGSSANMISAASAGQLFLDSLREVWEDHMACMSKLRDVFKYMVRAINPTPGTSPDVDNDHLNRTKSIRVLPHCHPSGISVCRSSSTT